jgi:hypothetical protein
MKHLLCLLALGACVPPSTTSTGWGEPPATAAAGSSCAQILACFSACGEATCYQQCHAAGDPAAQAAASALMACGMQQCANDSACIESTCGADMAACQQQLQQPQGPAQPGQPAQRGDLLAWLVGDWIGNNHQFSFGADGSVRRSNATAYTNRRGEYGCVYTVNEIGTVTHEGDMLIMVFPAVDQNNCGDKEQTAGLTVRYRAEWVTNPYADDPTELFLRLVDIDCTAGEMWCADRLRRR